MNESEFAKAYMNGGQQYDHIDIDYSLEVHYNNYGSRGCVDIVSEITEWHNGKSHGPSIEVVELKSEYAIEQATGANEIIRQFNKHKKNFFDGTDKYPRRKYNDRTFWLLLYATPATVSHVVENRELYKKAEQQHNANNYCIGLWHEDYNTLRFTSETIWERDSGMNEVKGWSK